MRAWATGSSAPTATLLNYGTFSLGPAPRCRSVGDRQGPHGQELQRTHPPGVDVAGYYIPKMHAYISSSGTILDQSGRLVSATKTGTGTYTLVWDRDVSTCTGVASSDLTGHIMSVYTSGVNSYVYSVNNAGGAEDYWSNVLINC